MLLTSPRLEAIPGIRHGFGTRACGVSAPQAVETDSTENRQRIAEKLGLGHVQDLIEVTQVHGVQVGIGPQDRGREADALVCREAAIAVGVRTADCAPILMAHRDASVVAAVHAGWRGATRGIIAEAVRAMAVPAGELVAAIGPTIGVDAFEVGPEVIEAAQASLGGQPPRTISGPRGRPHLDLVDLCRRHLIDAGVDPEAIDVVGGSTYAEPALYFSYRRDARTTGRHLSVIGRFET